MRHKKAPRRVVEPDPLYKNRTVSKFINRLMYSGKKNAAQSSFYNALELIKQKGQEPLETFEKAILNVAPKQEVKARRIGGASYQVPIEVRGERKNSLAIRWLISAARDRSNKDYHSFSDKLAAELMDAANNLGAAMRKKEIMQKSADANRAFAHFR